MFAVLTDGIECFQKFFAAKSCRGRNLFREAEAWINRRNYSSLFSFEHVCDVLNINASYLRFGLMRWRAVHDSTKTRKRLRESLRYRYRVKSKLADRERAL